MLSPSFLPSQLNSVTLHLFHLPVATLYPKSISEHWPGMHSECIKGILFKTAIQSKKNFPVLMRSSDRLSLHAFILIANRSNAQYLTRISTPFRQWLNTDHNHQTMTLRLVWSLMALLPFHTQGGTAKFPSPSVIAYTTASSAPLHECVILTRDATWGDMILDQNMWGTPVDKKWISLSADTASPNVIASSVLMMSSKWHLTAWVNSKSSSRIHIHRHTHEAHWALYSTCFHIWIARYSRAISQVNNWRVNQRVTINIAL